MTLFGRKKSRKVSSFKYCRENAMANRSTISLTITCISISKYSRKDTIYYRMYFKRGLINFSHQKYRFENLEGVIRVRNESDRKSWYSFSIFQNFVSISIKWNLRTYGLLVNYRRLFRGRSFVENVWPMALLN